MFKHLKALFKSHRDAKGSPRARRISHPRDLQTGDIVKFRFRDQQEISGNTFEVSQVNTYLYGNICYPELVLKDRSNTLIYMMVEEDDGDEYLALSKKVPKAKVLDILPQEQLTHLKDGRIGQTIDLGNLPDAYSGWATKRYSKTDHHVRGAFIKGDARFLSDAEIDQRDHFTSHTAEDSDEEYALELEIYESGEQELSITAYLEIEAIEEMWPKQAEKS